METFECGAKQTKSRSANNNSVFESPKPDMADTKSDITNPEKTEDSKFTDGKRLESEEFENISISTVENIPSCVIANGDEEYGGAENVGNDVLEVFHSSIKRRGSSFDSLKFEMAHDAIEEEDLSDIIEGDHHVQLHSDSVKKGQLVVKVSDVDDKFVPEETQENERYLSRNLSTGAEISDSKREPENANVMEREEMNKQKGVEGQRDQQDSVGGGPVSLQEHYEHTMDMRRRSESAVAAGDKPSDNFSEKYGIGRSSVSEILNRRDFYKEQFGKNVGCNVQRFGTSKYAELNSALYTWFCQARAKGFPLTGPIVQERALLMANELGSEFKASNGWLEAWRKKYNVKFYKVCGESNDVDLEEVEKFKNRLPEIIDNVSPENVFNSDETGLFFRALPDKTLSVKADACKGGKMAKERLTVMLTCSATGEKLKPLVIGKANRPRCFKNIKTENLPCTWRSNKKAWMTGETFQNWVFELNSEMKRQKRNILLFLDNATSHTDVTLSNVTIKFLPPNATSKLQPLDLGIIRAFKARYRKHLMRRLLSKMDSCETVSDLVKSLTVLDALHWIKQAWNETSSSTIVKCFRDAGFAFDSEVHDNNMDSSDDEYEDDDLPIAELVRRSQFAQQIHVEGVDDMHDAECVLPTEETYEGDWEKTILSDLVGKKCEDSDNDDDDDDSIHSVRDDVILKTSSFTDYKSVETCLEDLKLFALEKDDRFLQPILNLIELTEKCKLEKNCMKKQTTLDQFFK